MAKTISQSMFDDVVRENMEEFDMDAEAAVTEAVEQFEAQGVNLGMIVKDPSLFSGSGGQHAVVEAISSLQEALKSSDLESEMTHLQVIRDQCDLDLGHRVLASSNGAYVTLVDALKTAPSVDVRMACLDALRALVNGQPDVLTMPVVEHFFELLKQNQDNTSLLLLVTRIIRLTCIMHETNRQSYVEQGIVSHLSTLLEEQIDCAGLVTEVCSLLRILTADDDPRVPFGKGHEHAKMIVTEGDTLKKIMNICKVYREDASVQSELFLTLSRLAVRNEFCQEIMDLGGLQLILDVLQSNTGSQSITKHGLGLLKTISGNDDVKVAVAKAGGLELVLAAMAKHAKHPGIAEMGCGAVASVCLRQPDHCQRVIQAGGAEVIVKAMQLHQNVESVQSAGCLAVRNLIARTQEFCPAFLEQGAEAVLRQAQSRYPQCNDSAKGALRDLGCSVDLKELWKGEGKDIAR